MKLTSYLSSSHLNIYYHSNLFNHRISSHCITTGVFRYLPSPHILHIHPTAVSITGGALVRVYGAHFQPTVTNYTCVFNTPVATTPSTSTSASATTATTPTTATTTTPTTTVTSISVPAVCHSPALITCRAPPAPVTQRLSSPGLGSIQLFEQYLGEILPLGAGGASSVSATLPGVAAASGTTTGSTASTAVGVVASTSTSFRYQSNPTIDKVVLQVTHFTHSYRYPASRTPFTTCSHPSPTAFLLSTFSPPHPLTPSHPKRTLIAPLTYSPSFRWTSTPPCPTSSSLWRVLPQAPPPLPLVVPPLVPPPVAPPPIVLHPQVVPPVASPPVPPPPVASPSPPPRGCVTWTAPAAPRWWWRGTR